ncbi:MAG: TetR/AcrR family transcriptional regulator [Dehalococcoidia bacterium]
MPSQVPQATVIPPDRKPRLGLEEIVRAAVAIADEEGLAGVSMRRVADRLGRAVMSLYRHLKDKEELVALAADLVFADETFPAGAAPDWRTRVRESAFRQWRCYQRHPWIAEVVSLSRPGLGPNGIREMEWAFQGLQDLSISNAEKVRLYLVVVAFVHGVAGQMARETAEHRRSGQGADEWWKAQDNALRAVFASGDFPLVSRLAPGSGPSPESLFEFGLECLLDGLDRQVTRGTAAPER